MKRILVPITFSETTKKALKHAHLVAKEYGAILSLLHCYPHETYNREYQFKRESYDQGIKRMLTEFYDECIPGGEDHKYRLIAYEGPVSEFVAERSDQYDLLVMSRETGALHKRNSWFNDKLGYISSKSLCPVLITAAKPDSFSLREARSIWHIKRRDSETQLVNDHLRGLRIDPSLVAAKTMQQNTYISAFWRNIVAYSQTHDHHLLKDISSTFEKEKIDLVITVNHRKGLFEGFLKADAFQLISQFEIPILILPVSVPD